MSEILTVSFVKPAGGHAVQVHFEWTHHSLRPGDWPPGELSLDADFTSRKLTKWGLGLSIEEYLDGLNSRPQHSHGQQASFGRALFETIYRDTKLEGVLRRALGYLDHGLLVELRFDQELGELLRIPIELAHDEHGELLRRRNLCWTRSFLNLPPATLTLPDRGRILCAWAVTRPPGMEGFDPAPHVEALRRNLNGTGWEIVELARATRETLSARLKGEPWEVLHIVCHGQLHQGVGALYLEGATERGERVLADEFAEWVRGDEGRPSGTRIVWLNACESARTSPGAAFAGLAQACIDPGKGDAVLVVAAQAPLDCESSAKLAGHFYELLLFPGKERDAIRALAESRRQSYRPDDPQGGAMLAYDRAPKQRATVTVGPRTNVPPRAPEPALAPSPAVSPRPAIRVPAVDKVADLLRSEQFVALIGEPGAGKTTLARQLASAPAVSRLFKDGVHFLDVERARESVLSSMARAAGLSDLRRPDAAELARGLSGRKSLFVLDGVDRVSVEAQGSDVQGLTAELKEKSPGVSLLFTSSSETPRVTPGSVVSVRIEPMRPYQARRLLGVSAGEGAPASRPDRVLAREITDLARGNPLALELFGRLAQVIDLRDLTARATKKLEATGSVATAAIEVALEQLGAGCDGVDLVLHLIALLPAGIPSDLLHEALPRGAREALPGFANAGLMTTAGPSRYRAHPTVRDHAVALVGTPGGGGSHVLVKQAVLKVYAGLIRWIAECWPTSGREDARLVFERERDNLLSLIEWAVIHEPGPVPSYAALVAAYLADVESCPATDTGLLGLLERAAHHAWDLGDAAGGAECLYSAGSLLLREGGPREAFPRLDLARQRFVLAEEPGGEARCLRALAEALSRDLAPSGELAQRDRARQLAKRALELFRAQPDRRGECNVLLLLGDLAEAVDPTEALLSYTEALQGLTELGDLRGQANVHHRVGRLRMRLGRDGAEESLIRAARTHASLQEPFNLAGDLGALAQVMLVRGKHDLGIVLADVAVRLYRKRSAPYGEGIALRDLARLLASRGEWPAAVAAQRLAEAAWRSIDQPGWQDLAPELEEQLAKLPARAAEEARSRGGSFPETVRRAAVAASRRAAGPEWDELCARMPETLALLESEGLHSQA